MTSNSNPRYISNRNGHIKMPIQGSTLCKNPNQEISLMSINNQTGMNKLWHICIMECFTAMRNNKLLLHATV